MRWLPLPSAVSSALALKVRWSCRSFQVNFDIYTKFLWLFIIFKRQKPLSAYKNIIVFYRPIIKEGFKLCNITLWLIGAKLYRKKVQSRVKIVELFLVPRERSLIITATYNQSFLQQRDLGVISDNKNSSFEFVVQEQSSCACKHRCRANAPHLSVAA